jgi:hypothetical protein
VEPINLGPRLASAFAAPLIRMIFHKEGAGADIVDRPVRVSSIVAFKGEKRTLSDVELKRIGEQLVDRACQSMGPNEQLPGYELAAVKNAVIYSLRALGDLDMDDVQAVRLGHQALARRLMSAYPKATAGLSRDAVHLHEGVVRNAAIHILHFFTQRSTFVARTLVEQTRMMDELLRKVDNLVLRTPSPGDGLFEERYREYIEDKHGELNIFGLDLSESPERWPLGAAYLSLQANSDSSIVSAEQVLASHQRVLLRGVAGSGKTTLLQWLATATVGSGYDEKILYLRNLVAVVLPLRTLSRGRGPLPTPDKFLEAVGCPISGIQPPGWIDRVLTAGRGLVLVDGIDEIHASDRNNVRSWVREIIRAYPQNRWMVTSRPSAVREEWLKRDGFTEVDLIAMSRDNIASFITRWHKAAGVGDSYARALQRVIWGKQDVARLATNPLMCGLICALHRERRGYLPDSRKEMYDAALSMLLSRRDRERGISTSNTPRMSEDSQIRLVQKLAYWMTRNGQAEMSREDAISLLSQIIPAMPHIAREWQAIDIYLHLLIRSGLLREPTVESVEFVHRTFQDYLGAKAAVEDRDFDFLASNAHLDQWEDVIRMAVAHARPDERARLLTSLVERGDSCKEEDQRLHLLAAACLEHATELDPAIWSLVQERATRLIPPRSVAQARALAEAGPVVLDLLPGPDQISPDEAYFSVLTTIRIGTDAALPVLVKYREVSDSRIQRELVNAWPQFNTQAYAEEILAYLSEPELFFLVSTVEELCALDMLGGRTNLELHSSFSGDEVPDLDNAKKVTKLRLIIEKDIDWSWLSRFHNISEVQILSTLPEIDLAFFAKMRSLQFIEVPHGVRVIGVDLLTRRMEVRVSQLGGEDI